MLHERHAAILPRRFAQGEERGRVAVQKSVRHGVTTGDAFIAAAERDADLRRNPRLLGIGRDLVEDLAARSIERDAALDEIVGEAALEVQATCKIVDGSDTLALGIARAGRNRLRIDQRRGRYAILWFRRGWRVCVSVLSVTASSMAAFSLDGASARWTTQG